MKWTSCKRKTCFHINVTRYVHTLSAVIIHVCTLCTPVAISTIKEGGSQPFSYFKIKWCITLRDANDLCTCWCMQRVSKYLLGMLLRRFQTVFLALWGVMLPFVVCMTFVVEWWRGRVVNMWSCPSEPSLDKGTVSLSWFFRGRGVVPPRLMRLPAHCHHRLCVPPIYNSSHIVSTLERHNTSLGKACVDSIPHLLYQTMKPSLHGYIPVLIYCYNFPPRIIV